MPRWANRSRPSSNCAPASRLPTNWRPRSSATCATASRTTKRRNRWTSSVSCQGLQPESSSNESSSTATKKGALMFEFANKRYVVTGAASGIGHAVAEQLLAAGAEVYSLDRNTPTAAVTRHIDVDLSNPRSIDAAVEQLDGQFDGLMNVAGVPGTAPPDLVLAVNTLAVRQLTESIFDRLKPNATVT